MTLFEKVALVLAFFLALPALRTFAIGLVLLIAHVVRSLRGNA